MSTKAKATDEAQIRAVIERWADSLRNKDADDVLSHYAPKLVHFSLAPPVLSAVSDAKGLNAWFATWQGPIGYKIRNLSVTIGDDLAFSHSLNRMHGTKRMEQRVTFGSGTRSGSEGSMANGRSRTSTNQCPFTWTAASKPP
jgi:PhnB protein